MWRLLALFLTPPPNHYSMREKDKIVQLANHVLDRWSADPDDDLAMLARQYLKVREMCELILPMAKGYAAEHDVGNNRQMVQSVENYLSPTAAQPADAPVEEIIEISVWHLKKCMTATRMLCAMCCLTRPFPASKTSNPTSK